jgi:hypothetical protein
VRLLAFVDGVAGQRRVVEHHADGGARGPDRRARHPSAPDDARVAFVVLDDRAVVEHGEVLALCLGAPEGFAVGVADVVHDVALVDERAAQIRSPGSQHAAVRAVEQEDSGALQADAFERQLDRAAQDRVGVVERQDLVERGQQRREPAADRAVHDRGNGELGAENDRPIDTPPDRHDPNLC